MRTLAFASLFLIGVPRDVPPVDPADVPRLLAEIRPQPGESPWREIAWFTDVRLARERAAAEGKPIVIFTAADGSPLSRTWGSKMEYVRREIRLGDSWSYGIAIELVTSRTPADLIPPYNMLHYGGKRKYFEE